MITAVVSSAKVGTVRSSGVSGRPRRERLMRRDKTEDRRITTTCCKSGSFRSRGAGDQSREW